MLTKILSVLFFLYMGYVYYSFWMIIKPPGCEHQRDCVDSYLNRSPKLRVVLYTSLRKVPRASDVSRVRFDSEFDYNVSFERDINIDVPFKNLKSGTLFIHLFIADYKTSFEKMVQSPEAVHLTLPLTSSIIPRTAEVPLLSNTSSSTKKAKPVVHMKKKIAFFMLTENLSLPLRKIPPEIYGYLRMKNEKEFMPIVVENFLVDRLSNLQQLDPDAKNFTITLKYDSVGYGRFRILVQMKEAILAMYSFGFQDKDIDEVKSVVSDTNLYLLIATVTISFIHLLFDFLSFKTDIQFWHSRKSLTGISTASVLWRAFSQIIITVYLHHENASLIILIPSIISVLIELWKAQKMIPIDWRHMKLKQLKRNASENKTREFDVECLKYMSYVLIPLCISGAGYSLLYQHHRSWYSWILRSLVNGVYAFGFIFMLPQLFINYKLKSVAHLPWRNLMYKGFNTFIDDVFAFIITVPTAHRLACFRDDIVFIAYMVQRYLYPVDKSRSDDDAPEAIRDDSHDD